MEYVASTSKKYRYEGHFVRRVRSGYGVWHELSQYMLEYKDKLAQELQAQAIEEGNILAKLLCNKDLYFSPGMQPYL